MYRSRVPVAIVAFLLSVAGCTTGPTRVEGPGAGVDLATLKSWQANGRIAIAAGNSGGSGSFEWNQSGSETAVQLQGPVGIGGLRLTLNGADVVLESSDGRRLESEAAWTELEARLGAPVPAQSLRYWLLGLPAPGEHRWVEQTAERSILEQDGWQIAYESFVDQNGTRLPARLTATSTGARVRLIVDRWRLGSR